MIRGKDPKVIEMEDDERMARAVFDQYGKDKCVRIGCMTMIEPALNKDGFCTFHRPRDKA